MGEVTALRCITCGARYSPEALDYTCPDCGPRRGTLEVLYDYAGLRKRLTREGFRADPETSMWRYLPLLPIADRRFIQPLRVGWTPLYTFPDLAAEYGTKTWLIKDDGQNPTASYKDRASAVVVIKALERGKRVVTCASTGNAASSLAGFAAATPLETIIFVPKRAPKAKVAQLLIYGAKVFLVDGSYDTAYDLASEASEAFGWYDRSAARNPYLVEGKKTGALELAEQLDWDVPDLVAVSVGDGSVISGICKGFAELRELDLIDRVPRVFGIQADGASPIAAAFRARRGAEVRIEDVEASTAADSICVGKPRDIVKAVTYVTANGGGFVTVTDKEILDAIGILARRTGVFAEPAGAAAFAGLVKLAAREDLSEARVAAMITGNGLKDVGAVQRSTAGPIEIAPTLAAIKEHL